MILFDLMNKQMDNRCIKVEPELVVRQSCGTAMLLAQEI
jgi:LacI family transcriptional regulator